MYIARYLIPFSAGVAVGVALNKYWPQITEAGRPLLRTSLRSGSHLVDKGKAAVYGQTERLSDIIAEIREEDEAASRASAAGVTPPAPPKAT